MAGMYGSMKVGDSLATELKRSAVKNGQVSYNNTKRQPSARPGEGKFGGLPGGPSGGAMNTGGKRRPKSRTVRGLTG